jgi:phospholipid-translocating ATPase
MRHKADYEVNGKKVRVIRDGKFVTIESRRIKCGDIVEVQREKYFPCDLVLLHSKTDTGTCHIKTSNLDGETNLKVRQAPNKLPTLNDENDLLNLKGLITYEKPNTNLYQFRGKITINEIEYTLTNDNILLRGQNLKIAPVIYGCAIYTGRDTKMMLNSKFQKNKLSCIERRLNFFVAVCVIAMLLISAGCLLGAIGYSYVFNTHWYLISKTTDPLYFFIQYIFYLNLNQIVPLALYITLELQRFIGSSFFEWDLEMYDAKTDQPAKVHTTDLNEDLGQIRYLFSDKTGTLTENEMIFKHFGLEGKIYEEQNGNLFQVGFGEPIESIEEEKIKRFFEVLSLCHTVQMELVSSSNGEKYNASSPDELSFIKFCSKLGVIFEGDEINKETNKIMRKVVYKNETSKREEKFYEMVHVLEFDPNRKRMSVIIRDCQTSEYILYCKGADTSIFNVSTCGNAFKYTGCLKSFSENGWRTLVLSFKILTLDEFNEYNQLINDANNDILNREKNLAQVYSKLETNLTLIGVTAVEDKLQEDVENTLFSLRQAGIKIWVLTGDKLETAISISDSSKHFSYDMNKFVIANLNDKDEIKENLTTVKHQMDNNKHQSYALIIDGITLASIIENNLQNKFRDVAMKCDAVLCCRLSPSQKAFIVKLVKSSKYKPMTAAVGDGANDVSMIQEAHVGIGIFGKEGRHAARSADFAIAKFKFLKRVFLVHGYLYYTRAALLVFYFFYKNFTYSIVQFYYAFFNAFSSASLFPGLYLSFYNTALTSAPVLFMGLFEKRTSVKKLTEKPFYYRSISNNNLMKSRMFLLWVMLGIWHSGCSFFIPYALHYFNPAFYMDGKVGDLSNMSNMVTLLITVIAQLKIFIIWRSQDMYALASYLFSFGSFVVFCLIVNAFIMPFPLTLFTDDQSLFFSFFYVFSNPTQWLVILLSVVAAITPDLAIRLIENYMEKSEIEKLEKASKDLENKTRNYKFLDSFLFFNRNLKRSNSSSIFEMISLNKRMRDGQLNTKSDLSDRVKYSNIERIQPLVIYKSIFLPDGEPTLTSIKELSEK